MKRLFVAVDIELSLEFQKLTNQLQLELKNDNIVWVKSNLQHLTLRFLGETPEAKIEPITKVLSHIAKSSQPFELQIDKMGVFGSKHSPETLWYGFSEFSLFKNLFEKLENELIAIGFQENYGNFVPHITVGRIKKMAHKKHFWETFEKLQPQFTQTISVNHLKLIQSKLNRDGPKYRTIFDTVISD